LVLIEKEKELELLNEDLTLKGKKASRELLGFATSAGVSYLRGKGFAKVLVD